jgi:hypothetical protein
VHGVHTLRFYDYDEKKCINEFNAKRSDCDFKSHVTKLHFSDQRAITRFRHWSTASSLRTFWVILSGPDGFKWGCDLTLQSKTVTCDMILKSETMGECCFFYCRSRTSVTFELGSRLSRIVDEVFSENVLIEIIIPASVDVLCVKCFAQCRSLSSITFEPSSRLREIDRTTFSEVPIVPTFPAKWCSHWWCNSGQSNVREATFW